MRFATLLLCLMLAAGSALAKDLRIGTVDLQKLFKEYPGTDKAQQKFKALAEKKQKDLEEAAEELKDLQNDLKKSSSVLSAKQKKQKEAEFKQKAQDYAAAENQARAFLATKESDMTQAILDEIKGIVAGVAKSNGVDLVLDSDKTVYVNNGTDLTSDVEKSFKKLAAESSDDPGTKKK